jgi:hypothetical protein
MRVSHLSLVCLLSLVFIFSTCKKGPEDPALSLRTRKARLCGSWRIKTGQAVFTYKDSNGAIVVYDYKLDASGGTIYETPASQQLTIYKLAYSLNLEILKDGTFSIVERAGIDLLQGSGTWNFTGKIGETKNKDGVVFNIDKVTLGASNKHLFNKTRLEFTYKLIELRNKEIKLRSDTKSYLDGNGNFDKFTGDYTLIQ